MEKAKIMVVDDDFIVRTFITEILESVDKYEVIQAEDGEEALALFNADPAIQVVISDVNMPNMDGLDLLKGIRRQGSAAPVLLLTSEKDRWAGVAGISLGATGYMAKDDEFQSAIFPWLEKVLG